MYAETDTTAPACPLLLGPETSIVDCPYCQSHIMTTVKHTSNTNTHIAAANWSRLCCLCCIPFCSDSAKNADHYCPCCQKYLGTYRK
ncbi:hypothetical protein ABMA27_011818 [Loxostege sticticalis]|uniref:LITAF domain-containing protein n=1 Tax=Loxostege sticticalis TaxID=481309 RepID=A0ABR3IHQ1_LOXSC